MIIDDQSRNDALAVSLRKLNALAKILKQKRIDNGYVLVFFNSSCSRILTCLEGEGHI